MAGVGVVKSSVLLCREAGVVPFVWGHRGLGKSSLVRQLCLERGWGFVDLRCSQLEASDLRGLPDRVGGRTVFLPPCDLPVGDLSREEGLGLLGGLVVGGGEWVGLQGRLCEGVLFLDEVNRAGDDVLQALFQLVLDRRVGGYVLPAGWSVVCAGNFMDGSYVVGGFNDCAFLDRFCHLVLSGGDGSFGEWVDYMGAVFGDSEACARVVDFVSGNVEFLDGVVGGDLGFSVLPSRRSWEAVVRVLGVGGFDDVVVGEVVCGLVGREVGRGFLEYSCKVKPGDLLAGGVGAFREVLLGLSRGELVGLCWGLVSFVRGRLGDGVVAGVCLDFAEFLLDCRGLDRDVVVSFCRALVSAGCSGVDARVMPAVLSNPSLAKIVASFGGGGEKRFVDWLVGRPRLQELLRAASWGRG